MMSIIKDIRAQIDADTLELHYAQGNVEMAVEALAELKYEKDIKIKNNDVPLEVVQAIVAACCSSQYFSFP